MRIDRDLAADVARIGMQTAAATVVVYLVVGWLGLDHLSWAVISALFTIRPSTDSAYAAGRNRILAALIGTAIGLAAAIGYRGPEEALVALALAAAAANMISAARPELAYASVTAAIVALSPAADVEAAAGRAFAILVGTVAGIAVTFVVWPEFGRRRGLRQIAAAVDDCRALLVESVACVAGARPSRTREVTIRFNGHLETAEATIAETRFRPRLTGGGTLRDLLLTVDRLWHGLVLLDRATEERAGSYSAEDRARLREEVGAAGNAAAAFLDEAAGSLRGSGGPPDPAGVLAALGAARSAAASAEVGAPPGSQRRMALGGLVFALAEVEKNIVELAGLLGSADVAPGQDTAAGRADRAA